jgi:hypothetical protein
MKIWHFRNKSYMFKFGHLSGHLLVRKNTRLVPISVQVKYMYHSRVKKLCPYPSGSQRVFDTCVRIVIPTDIACERWISHWEKRRAADVWRCVFHFETLCKHCQRGSPRWGWLPGAHHQKWRIGDTGANGRLLMRVKRTANHLYLLTVKLPVTAYLLTCREAEAWRWHQRLGHLNFQAMKKMVKEELAWGLPDMAAMEHPCRACLAGKQRRSPFPTQDKYCSSRVLELIHEDLCGKISPPTRNQYFLLLVDDRNSFMSVVLLSWKDQAVNAIQKFQARVECETSEKLGGLRTDRGGEFNSKNFAEYCLELGVRRQLVAPYSPQ